MQREEVPCPFPTPHPLTAMPTASITACRVNGHLLEKCFLEFFGSLCPTVQIQKTGVRPSCTAELDQKTHARVPCSADWLLAGVCVGMGGWVGG